MIYCNNKCKHQVEGICVLESISQTANKDSKDSKDDCVYYDEQKTEYKNKKYT